MSKGLVTIFGGSGFIGRYAARALVREILDTEVPE